MNTTSDPSGPGANPAAPSAPVTVSIIICTRDRAADLRGTLAAVAGVRVPDRWACELLLVDNGSTDDTPAVTAAFGHPRMTVRPLSVPVPGKSRALNVAMAAATGRVLLFTDDDCRPPATWVEDMCRPIVDGRADAVAGGVRIADHLVRPWMGPTHRAWLASSEPLDPVAPQNMIGANMAFARDVLARVPAFDPELGPAGTGAGEEMLFSWQLLAAGFRMIHLPAAAVEHHFDPARLGRASFLRLADSRGRTGGYLTHHWAHDPPRRPRLRLMKRRLRLLFARAVRPRQWLGGRAPEWELAIVEHVAFYRQYLLERRRPRNYERRGLARAR